MENNATTITAEETALVAPDGSGCPWGCRGRGSLSGLGRRKSVERLFQGGGGAIEESLVKI